MKNTKLLSLILTFTLFILNTNAQTKDEMKRWMDYSTPGDMHKMLATSDGMWNAEIKMWMNPNQPPQISKGTMENKMILGGRYQESIYTGNFGGMPFEGHSTTGYDNLQKQFNLPG